MNTNKIIIGAVVAFVVISAASFYAGMKYANGSTHTSQGVSAQARAARFGQGSTTGGARAGIFRNGAPTIGSIVAKDATSVTVKLLNGGSLIAFYNASTTVSKTAQSSLDAIAVGDAVMINGSANPDGSINAQSIQDGIDVSRLRAPQTFSASASN